MKFKIIKQRNLSEFLINHHGKKIENNGDTSSTYYECDNNIIVVVNNLVNIATAYFDRDKFYREQESVKKWRNFVPFKDQQEIILEIETKRSEIIGELFTKFNMERPPKLSDTNLKKLDLSIKNYGFEKAINNLYFELVVFCGEYIREKKSGAWLIKSSTPNPQLNYPVYIDKDGRSYEFEINTVILKDFREKFKISLLKVLQSAEAPEFKIAPNPYGQRF